MIDPQGGYFEQYDEVSLKLPDDPTLVTRSRRRWIASLMAIFLLLCGLGVLTWKYDDGQNENKMLRKNIQNLRKKLKALSKKTKSETTKETASGRKSEEEEDEEDCSELNDKLRAQIELHEKVQEFLIGFKGDIVEEVMFGVASAGGYTNVLKKLKSDPQEAPAASSQVAESSQAAESSPAVITVPYAGRYTKVLKKTKSYPRGHRKLSKRKFNPILSNVLEDPAESSQAAKSSQAVESRATAESNQAGESTSQAAGSSQATSPSAPAESSAAAEFLYEEDQGMFVLLVAAEINLEINTKVLNKQKLYPQDVLEAPAESSQATKSSQAVESTAAAESNQATESTSQAAGSSQAASSSAPAESSDDLEEKATQKTKLEEKNKEARQETLEKKLNLASVMEIIAARQQQKLEIQQRYTCKKTEALPTALEEILNPSKCSTSNEDQSESASSIT